MFLLKFFRCVYLGSVVLNRPCPYPGITEVDNHSLTYFLTNYFTSGESGLYELKLFS